MSKPNFLTPWALASQLPPYKKLLGILLRESCVSLAVSNEYASLAEPLGAVLLRNGKLPDTSLHRLLRPVAKDIAGVVVGSEQQIAFSRVNGTPVEAQLHHLQGILHELAPGLPCAWWDRWDAGAATSCRILPQGGPAGAKVMELSSAVAATARKADSGERCSLGTAFLQDYLDGLGTTNTFG